MPGSESKAPFDKELIAEVKEMRQQGLSAFSSTTRRDTTIEELQDSDRSTAEISWVAGRVTRVNETSNYHFLDISDSTGRIQLFIDESETELDKTEYLRIGDIIEVTGWLMKTNSGELSIDVSDIHFLAKSLRHFSFDESLNTSHRHTDRERVLLTTNLRCVLRKRFKITRLIRSFLSDEGYCEVTTPIVQSIYSGGSSQPFVIKPNIGDRQYLRATMEIEMKEMIAGGYERIFQIGKIFRNEDIDRNHYPVKTIVELYEIFTDYQDMMKLTEQLVQNLFNAHDLYSEIEYDGNMINIGSDWPRISMFTALNEHSDINISGTSDEDLIEMANEESPEPRTFNTAGQALHYLFKTIAAKNIRSPTFVIDHPKISSPLCSEHRDDDDRIERGGLWIAGMKIADTATEATDPIYQGHRLAKQAQRLEQKKEINKRLINILSYGLPPTGGLGIGIDRLTMLLTNTKSVKSVKPFLF